MTTQAIADETVDRSTQPRRRTRAPEAPQAAPAAHPAPAVADGHRQPDQRTATALETAKTGQIDADAEMEAARAAALSANTAVAHTTGAPSFSERLAGTASD